MICCYQVSISASPKFSARGTAPLSRLLHGALVMFGPFTDLHNPPRNQGQSSSSSSLKSRMRGDADTSAQGMGRPVVGLTPAPNCREDPSMEFHSTTQ